MMTISKEDCPPTMFSISDNYYAGVVSPPVITMQTITDSLGVWSNVTLICEASGFLLLPSSQLMVRWLLYT